MKILTIISFFLFLQIFSFGQIKNEKLIQFSGVVMTSDSLRPVPYASIIIKNTTRGTISNYLGFFSLVAKPGDTILFSSIGYKNVEFHIPRVLSEIKYSLIQLMTQDTVFLAETIVYPWPTPDQFREVFLKLDIPDDDLERAKKNLQREILREMGQAMAMDGRENQSYYQRQEAARFYYSGQLKPVNILNPMAWAEFIKAWQEGKFKKQ